MSVYCRDCGTRQRFREGLFIEESHMGLECDKSIVELYMGLESDESIVDVLNMFNIPHISVQMHRAFQKRACLNNYV